MILALLSVLSVTICGVKYKVQLECLQNFTITF